MQSAHGSQVVTPAEKFRLQPLFPSGTVIEFPASEPRTWRVLYVLLRTCYKPLMDLCPAGAAIDWNRNLSKITREDADVFSLVYSELFEQKLAEKPNKSLAAAMPDWHLPRCTLKVAMEISTIAAQTSIQSPQQLNRHYKSFSSETYGETNLEQMASILDELRLGPEDVFVDLGSGIGQLVCFAATYANVKKCVGVEIAALPAQLASSYSDCFKQFTAHFGKECSEFELHQGDFLAPQFKKLICEEATVIFINNFAFDPQLMHRIVFELLQELNHGVRIVTSKPFTSPKAELNSRGMTDFSAMSDSTTLKSIDNNVSWTSNTITFTLTTVNHEKLFTHFEQNGAGRRAGARSSRRQATAESAAPAEQEGATNRQERATTSRSGLKKVSKSVIKKPVKSNKK
ncbi:unnamed protein product [Caenorhabditis sp. 36 PRJEB53466]|nr:unnamed protein product [Caenorhabditis sp. 36 PRJEB53466]